MSIYCIDTSSLIAAWQERYPIENFPSFWGKLDELIKKKRLLSPIEVLNEMKKRSDDLHAWLKARPEMFRDLEEKIQIEAANVLGEIPSPCRGKTASDIGRPVCDCSCQGREPANSHG